MSLAFHVKFEKKEHIYSRPIYLLVVSPYTINMIWYIIFSNSMDQTF
jgi:hypothetical protein